MEDHHEGEGSALPGPPRHIEQIGAYLPGDLDAPEETPGGGRRSYEGASGREPEYAQHVEYRLPQHALLLYPAVRWSTSVY